jgi:hypothetical protein
MGNHPTTLMEAVKYNDRKAVEEFLAKPGANIHKVVEEAAANGHAKLVDKLISKYGANVKEAIRGAIRGDNVALTKRLLTRPGADLNDAIYAAATYDQVELLEMLLLMPGADLCSALQGAAYYNHVSLVEDLLTRFPSGIISLTIAITIAITSAASNDSVEVIEKLLTKPGGNLTPVVVVALSNNNIGLIHKLIPRLKTANVLHRFTILSTIIESFPQYIELFEDLIAEPIIPSFLLDLAIEYKRDFLIAKLLDRYELYTASTVRKLAKNNCIKLVEKLLTRPGAINAALDGAALGNHTDLVMELLARPGADINAALVGAALGNHTDLVMELLTRPGADIDTALLAAAREKHLALIEKLLSKSKSATEISVIVIASIGHELLLWQRLKKQPNYAIYGLIGAIMGCNMELIKKFPKELIELKYKEVLRFAAGNNGDDASIFNYLYKKAKAPEDLSLVDDHGKETAFAVELREHAIQSGNSKICNAINELISQLQISSNLDQVKRQELQAQLAKAKERYEDVKNKNIPIKTLNDRYLILYNTYIELISLELLPNNNATEAIRLLGECEKECLIGKQTLYKEGAIYYAIKGMIYCKNAREFKRQKDVEENEAKRNIYQDEQNNELVKAKEALKEARLRLGSDRHQLLELGEALILLEEERGEESIEIVDRALHNTAAIEPNSALGRITSHLKGIVNEDRRFIERFKAENNSDQIFAILEEIRKNTSLLPSIAVQVEDTNQMVREIQKALDKAQQTIDNLPVNLVSIKQEAKKEPVFQDESETIRSFYHLLKGILVGYYETGLDVALKGKSPTMPSTVDTSGKVAGDIMNIAKAAGSALTSNATAIPVAGAGVGLIVDTARECYNQHLIKLFLNFAFALGYDKDAGIKTIEGEVKVITEAWKGQLNKLSYDNQGVVKAAKWAAKLLFEKLSNEKADLNHYKGEKKLTIKVSCPRLTEYDLNKILKETTRFLDLLLKGKTKMLSNTLLSTNDGNKWTANGMFSKVKVEVNGQYYYNKEHPAKDKYGTIQLTEGRSIIVGYRSTTPSANIGKPKTACCSLM